MLSKGMGGSADFRATQNAAILVDKRGYVYCGIREGEFMPSVGRHAYDLGDSGFGRIVQRRSKEPRAPHELIRRTLLDAEVRFFCETESHISIHAEKYEDRSALCVAGHAIPQSRLEVYGAAVVMISWRRSPIDAWDPNISGIFSRTENPLAQSRKCRRLFSSTPLSPQPYARYPKDRPSVASSSGGVKNHPLPMSLSGASSSRHPCGKIRGPVRPLRCRRPSLLSWSSYMIPFSPQ